MPFPFFFDQKIIQKFQEMCSNQRFPLFIVFILFGLTRIFPIDSAYIKSRCGFQSQNYTIKWAFESQTQNVVFVLKAKLPEKELNLELDGGKQLITGIGFGNEDQLDFIGVMRINDQLDLVSGHLEGAEKNGNGKGFKLSPVANGNGEGANGIQSISLKRRNIDGSVIAEFARPLNGGEGHKMADLSGCTTFFLVTKWIQYEPGAMNNKLPMSAIVRRNVCALAEKCSLDIREVNGQNVKEEDNKKVDSKITKNTQRDNGIDVENSETPELGESVDISGKGDPCSFSGTNYALRWAYDKATDSMEFIMKQKPKKGKWWSAVGIGDNMSDMDIGIIFLDDGAPKEMSDYFSSSYDVPDKDSNQDWKLDKKESKWNENDVELHFSRKLITKDAEKDRTLDGCVLFQFAANAGRYGAGNRIHKHEDWPDLYKACDLKKRCIRQKRQSSNEEDNLSVVSHSTDDRSGGKGNQQIEGGPNSSGDKVINLLMKSLGPQIVKTVSESEAANSDYRNTTIGSFGVKESATGSATIFSIIEDGAEEGGNYTQNGKENGQRELAESEEGNSEEEKRGKLEFKPIGEKRQEQNGDEENTNTNAENSPTTTSLASISSTSGGETEEGSSTLEETYSSLTASSIATPIQNTAMPVAVPQPNTGSPFSLNAFLGGEQTSPENLVPVGEPSSNRTSEGPNGRGENGQSTSIVRISGEAASAEIGETTLAGGNGFGINQMFGGEGSSNSGGEEAIERTNDGKTTNPPTSIGPSELRTSLTPIVENESTSSSAEEEGHSAEEGPQMIGDTQMPPVNNSLPSTISSSANSPAGTFSTNTNESSTIEVGTEAENVPTTYGVLNITSTPEENQSSSSTGGFELIASAGESTTSTILPSQTTLQTSSAIPSSTPIVSSISASNTPPPSNHTTNEEKSDDNDENELYSTPTTKSTPEFISPILTSSTLLSSTQNRMSIEGKGPSSNSNGLEDGGNHNELSTLLSVNNSSSENVEIWGNNRNALEKLNGSISPQTSDNNGSGDLEERGIKLPVATSKCDVLRPDLPICQSYMGAYLERVKDWAERHGEPMNNQFPKACKLLSAIPHVPTLCCQIFAEKCADYI